MISKQFAKESESLISEWDNVVSIGYGHAALCEVGNGLRNKLNAVIRAAKAMETGTAKTEGLGAKHDSAVAKPFAQGAGS